MQVCMDVTVQYGKTKLCYKHFSLRKYQPNQLCVLTHCTNNRLQSECHFSLPGYSGGQDRVEVYDGKRLA